MRNLTNLHTVNREIASARSISDVTRIARLACGYRFVPLHVPAVEYTATDRAWFARPVGAL